MKKHRIISLLSAASLLCMTPLPVSAETVMQNGSAVSQNAENTVSADESELSVRAAQPSADDYSGKGIAVLVLVCSPGNIPPVCPL